MNNDISVFNPSYNKMFTDTFEIYHYRQPYFKPLDFHNHDFYEFYIFLDGFVTYHIEEKEYELCAGDILVIPPGKMHRPVITDNNAVYERIVLWLDVNFINSIDNESHTILKFLENIEKSKNYLFSLKKEDFNFCTILLKKLIESSLSTTSSLIFKKAYIIMFLEQIIKQADSSKETALNEKYDVIQEIIYYINGHITEKLSLDDISREFFISKFHLIRKFKEYTNATIYDYIISKRVVLSKKFLREGFSATDTAIKSGFSDYSNFYKSFTKKTGITPAEFKRTNIP